MHSPVILIKPIMITVVLINPLFVLGQIFVLIIMAQKHLINSSALLIQPAYKDIKDLCARHVIMTMTISQRLLASAENVRKIGSLL